MNIITSVYINKLRLYKSIQNDHLDFQILIWMFSDEKQKLSEGTPRNLLSCLSTWEIIEEALRISAVNNQQVRHKNSRWNRQQRKLKQSISQYRTWEDHPIVLKFVAQFYVLVTKNIALRGTATEKLPSLVFIIVPCIVNFYKA